jgi:hypothetical protein
VSVAQLRRVLDDLADVPEVAMREATVMVEGFAKESGRPVMIKGKRYELTATTVVERRGPTEVSATVFGKPTGFWVWQNTGTRPHTIAPPAGIHKHRRRVIAPARGGSGWNHPQSVPVHHKGATGRGRWREVDRLARREVGQVFRDTVHDAVKAVQ